MKHILIIEDNINTRELIHNIVYDIDPKSKIYMIGSIEEARKIVSEITIDLFIIDVQLEDGNGLDYAKEIRKLSQHVLTHIVFVTAVPTHAILAYEEVHCYSYIIKPFERSKLERQLETLILHDKERTVEDKKIEISMKNHIYVLAEKKILYIEARQKKIFIITEDEEIMVPKTSISKLSQLLSNDFIQVHKAFIVNKNKIYKINKSEKTIILELNTELIPIGRTFYKNFMEYYSCL